jgi:hypothetical protein
MRLLSSHPTHAHGVALPTEDVPHGTAKGENERYDEERSFKSTARLHVQMLELEGKFQGVPLPLAHPRTPPRLQDFYGVSAKIRALDLICIMLYD